MKIELFPFSFYEYCECQKISTAHGTTKEKGLLRAAFDNYLHDGGFPELSNEKRKQTYINTLVDSILKKDIEKRYAVRYKAAFENITNHLLNNAPAKTNYSDLQTQFGLRSDHTAENYVNYTKNAYLICGLSKYSSKSKIRIRDEKAYAVDVALMNNRENALADVWKQLFILNCCVVTSPWNVMFIIIMMKLPGKLILLYAKVTQFSRSYS